MRRSRQKRRFCQPWRKPERASGGRRRTELGSADRAHGCNADLWRAQSGCDRRLRVGCNLRVLPSRRTTSAARRLATGCQKPAHNCHGRDSTRVTPPIRFRFAEFVLSPRQRLLLRNGKSVALIPSTLDLLLLLIVRRHQCLRGRRVWLRAHVGLDTQARLCRLVIRFQGHQARSPLAAGRQSLERELLHASAAALAVRARLRGLWRVEIAELIGRDLMAGRIRLSGADRKLP